MKLFRAGIIAALCLLSTAMATETDFSLFKVKPSLYKKYGGEPRALHGDKQIIDDNRLPPLLKKIWEKLKEKALDEVNDMTEDMIDFNQDFEFGESNFSGFDWNALDTDFEIEAGRRVDRDYMNPNRWIVRDRLEVTIDARTFLRRQAEEGHIDISDVNLAAFAGIMFRRTYTYTHFADSYWKGLKSDFKKLFFSFMKFHKENYLSIETGERITRQDFISARFGIGARTPSFYNIYIQGGLTVAFSKIGSTEVHKPTVQDIPFRDELVRVNIEKEKVVGVSAVIKAKAEFFNLLKVTLLRFEYHRSLSKSNKTYMSFSQKDLKELKGDTPLRREMRKILKTKMPKEEDAIKPYIVSKEARKLQASHFRYMLFLWGAKSGNRNEDFLIHTKNGTRYFFRHSSEKLRVSKGVVNAIIAPGKIKKYLAHDVDTVDMEYEISSEQRELPYDEILLKDPQNMSIRLTKEYYAKKTKEWLTGKYRKKAVQFIETHTSLDHKIVEAVKEKVIVGPMTISINAQLGQKSMVHLLSRTDAELIGAIIKVCRKKDEKTPDELKGRSKRCYKKIVKTLSAFLTDYRVKGRYYVWKLKKFVHAVAKYAKTLNHMKLFFGDKNMHVAGMLKAKTSGGQRYTTFFTEGPFQGKGLIAQTLRELGMSKK